MVDLKTDYLGLTLKNPIIVGSSGLSNTPDGVKKLEDAGAGAVVLKSLFEEQIMVEANMSIVANEYDYPESADYIRNYSQAKSIDAYLDLIEKSKKTTGIPIIASVNCVTDKEWVGFAKRLEDAGADALEVNISVLPSDVAVSSEDNEKLYLRILEKVHAGIRIPLALKMSNSSSGLANMIRKINWAGHVKGFVMFNRHYCPDIDLDNMKMITAPVFSQPDLYPETLRWVALMSDKIEADISATSGIHDSKTAIKMILAGAKTVQLASAVYKQGPSVITTIISEMEAWMKSKNYLKVSDFRGKMSMESIANPSVYERVQFMKYFSGIE
jgi:dihydroorotate dehydrogenase (fumarate)